MSHGWVLDWNRTRACGASPTGDTSSITVSASYYLDLLWQVFDMLIPGCQERGIHVAITTFSPQCKLIEKVLKLRFREGDLKNRDLKSPPFFTPTK